VNGKETDEVPAQASGYDKIECIYARWPDGYANAGDSDGRSVAEGCREYLAFIEKETGARVE